MDWKIHSYELHTDAQTEIALDQAARVLSCLYYPPTETIQLYVFEPLRNAGGRRGPPYDVRRFVALSTGAAIQVSAVARHLLIGTVFAGTDARHVFEILQ